MIILKILSLFLIPDIPLKSTKFIILENIFVRLLMWPSFSITGIIGIFDPISHEVFTSEPVLILTIENKGCRTFAT